MIHKQQKCGYVAIIGKTNAGKSTLINSILSDKVSIVTRKPQTTIQNIIAIQNIKNTQIIFIDTPGVSDKKYQNIIAKNITKQANKALNEANLIIYLIDVTNPNHHEISDILQKIDPEKYQIWLAINKIDLIKKDKLLPITKKLQQKFPFQKIWMISAKKNDGVLDIQKAIIENMPYEKWLFPKYKLSKNILQNNNPQIFAEITREKILSFIHQEIPYNIFVKTEQIQKIKRKIFIKQIIYVGKNNHKAILIGENAATIKNISIKARKDIEQKLQSNVVLVIDVKTKTKEWVQQQLEIQTSNTLYS